jgi:tryptophanyl-tRNA synthetase
MAKILTGVQSTGTPHLGNLLGAILPAIEMANSKENESFIFIANLHSATQIKDAKTLKENTYSVAATWLACGLDVNHVTFYRQSDVPQTTELTWYLSCFFSISAIDIGSFVQRQSFCSFRCEYRTFYLPDANGSRYFAV